MSRQLKARDQNGCGLSCIAGLTKGAKVERVAYLTYFSHVVQALNGIV